MKRFFFPIVAIFIIATIVCMTSCKVQKPYSQTGVALCRQMIKPPGQSDFVKMDYIKDLKFLFKDSLVIEERGGFASVVDSSGNETVSEFTDHYTFIDLKSREHYDYKTFSDTAKVIRNFSHMDAIKANGGFDFFALKNTTFSSGGVLMADTAFEGITYKRVVKDSTYMANDGSFNKIRHIAYLRCDLKGLVIGFEKKLSQRVGCPVVRTDWVNLTNGGVIAAEIKIISNELSPQESKVFKVWEQNAHVYSAGRQ